MSLMKEKYLCAYYFAQSSANLLHGIDAIGQSLIGMLEGSEIDHMNSNGSVPFSFKICIRNVE